MGQSLRILHVTKRFWPYPGGVERYVLDLGVAQARRGHEVHVLTIDHDVMAAGPRLPEREERAGISIHRVRAVGGPRKQWLAESPGRVLRLARYADVIHHHEPRFLFETIAIERLVTRRPTVFHTHGMVMHTPAFRLFKMAAMRLYYGPMLRHGLDAVIAGSDADVEMLERYAGITTGVRIRLLREGIDLTRYGAIARERVPGRILSFGRIDHHKGHRRLLDALARMDGPWRLDIVGDGPTELVSSLRRQAEALGLAERVHWLGRVSDEQLDSLLRQTAIAVFPSEYEGFGLALLEALAAGVPVIANDIAAHREILGPDLADRLVAFDAPIVTERLREATLGAPGPGDDDPRERARAREFSVDRLVSEIESLYGELGVAPGRPLLGAATR